MSTCLYSNSDQIIYSLTTFMDSNTAAFYILDAGSGASIYGPYAFTNNVNQASGIIALINNIAYFVLNKDSISSYLIQFDTSSKSSKVYSLNSVTLYKISKTFDSFRLIFLGQFNSPTNAFLSKVKPEQLPYDSFLTLTPYSLSEASSTYPITSVTSPQSPMLDSFTTTSPTYPSTTIVLTQVSSLNTDISFDCSPITSTILQNSLVDIPISLSCSITDSITISYSLQSSPSGSPPAWIILDTANRKLVADTSSVAAGTSVVLKIKSINASYQICDKAVNISVVNCNVSNCMTCISTNANSCQTCKSGYKIILGSSSNYSCEVIASTSSNTTSSSSTSSTTTSNTTETTSSTSEKASVVTQSVVGAAAGATMVFSFCNLSTPQGLWITMNQFQLILLLLLTNSCIPKSIVDYLAGLKATTCSMNFIPFKDIPGLKWIVNSLDHKLVNKSLDYFGIFSGSTFANNFSFICLMTVIAIIHSLFLILFKYLQRKYAHKPTMIKILKTVYQLFSFTIYFRFILEVNQFMMLSSFSEIKLWDVENVSKIISLCIAIIISSLCIGLILLTFVYWVKNRNLESIDHYMPLKVLFSGLKNNSRPRLYSTILLTRRAFLVIFLVMSSSIPSIGIIIPMMVVQVLYLALMIAIRPYKSIKDNLLEITNEVFYFVLISLLSNYNSDSKWSKSAENAYLFLIIGNSVAIISIMIIAITIQVSYKIINKCRGIKTEPKNKNDKTFKSRTIEGENSDFNPSNNDIATPNKSGSSVLESEGQMDAVRYYYSKQNQDKSMPRSNIHYHESENAEYWKNYNKNFRS